MAQQKKAKLKIKGRASPAPKLSDEKQSARFKEMARTLGADESGRHFKKAFEKIIPAKKRFQA